MENPWAMWEKNHDLPLEGFTNPLACKPKKRQTVTDYRYLSNLTVKTTRSITLDLANTLGTDTLVPTK